MATIEYIKKRITNMENNISVLTARLARIELAEKSNWDDNNPYLYGPNDKDRTIQDLEIARAGLEKYLNQLAEEQAKAASRNVAPILEFLDLWKKRCIEYYGAGLKAVFDDKAEIRALENARNQILWGDPQRDELEKTIINSLTKMCLDYINKDKIKNNVLNNLTEDNKFNYKKELEILTNDIKQINDNLDTIYIDKLNKKITEEQFERVKIKLQNELNIKQKRYNELNNNINDIINDESKNKMVMKYVNKFLSMKEPSRELIINLIDKIEIFEDKTINIKVSFNKV